MEDYSIDTKNLETTSNLLFARTVLALDGDETADRKALCENLQLAPLRSSEDSVWPSGGEYEIIGNHAKLFSVNGEVSYVASQNFYPTYQQEYGYVLEDVTALESFKRTYADPIWQYSRAAAVFDYATGKCDIGAVM